MKIFDKWLEETHPEYLEEGWKDWARKGVMAASLGAASLGLMPGQAQAAGPSSARPAIESPFQEIKPGDPTIRAKFNNYTTEHSTMSGDEWQAYARYYGQPRLGFVPNPKEVGSWIPGNGADAVRVQSVTQVNNDNLTRDDTGLTPYKAGRPLSPTQWQHDGQAQRPLDVRTLNQYQKRLDKGL